MVFSVARQWHLCAGGLLLECGLVAGALVGWLVYAPSSRNRGRSSIELLERQVCVELARTFPAACYHAAELGIAPRTETALLLAAVS